MQDYSYYLVVGAAASVFLLLVWQHAHDQKQYPPGPPRKFLVGNLKDIPKGGHEWIAYEDMGRSCGSDIVYLNVLGSHILVLNSFEAAHDLLEKKGSVYSSRPRLVALKELRGWDWNLVLMSYGKRFTAHRRVVQQEFQPLVVQQYYRPVMSLEVIRLLDRLFSSPEALVKHLKQMAGAIIMMVTYGHQVTSADDKFVALAEAIRDKGAKDITNNIIEMFPFLKYTPDWFPGASFKREAVFSRQRSTDMRTAPHDMVKESLAAGTAVPSIVSRLLQTEDLSTADLDREEFIKNCGGVVYSAGADTTAAALTNFFLAMVLCPEIQEKAQREIDQVVGRGRLPTFSDRASLPYISRVVKETLRWMPVTPLGVPHSTTESDQYRNMYVPKNTTIIANIYAILHDPEVYKNPHEFNPDRFAPSPGKPDGEPDPTRATFGFGRRICPGRFFADDSVWLSIASVLHVFRILRPKDAIAADYDGIKWTSGFIGMPSPFPFTITARFQSARDLVKTASEDSA